MKEQKMIRLQRKEFRRKLTFPSRIALAMSNFLEDAKAEEVSTHEISKEIRHVPGCPCCSGVFYYNGPQYRTVSTGPSGPWGGSGAISFATGKHLERSRCKDCAAGRRKVSSKEGILLEAGDIEGGQLKRKYRQDG